MTAEASASRRSARRFTAFAVVGVLVLAGLGTWQVQRLGWKEDLIARREAGLAAAPLQPDAVETPRHEYRRVALSGRFVDGGDFRLAGRVHKGEPGFDMVSPLRLEGGGTVFVDRGWVPYRADGAIDRAAEAPDGTVRFTGLIRVPHGPNWFAPDNDPADNTWYWPDLAAMAARGGIDAETRWYAMAGRDAPWQAPVPHTFAVDLRNQHLQYAITWYALAVALAVIAWLYRRRASGDA